MDYVRTQFRGLVRTVEPTASVVSIVELRDFLGLAPDDTSFDDMLEAFIQVATDYLEEQTGAALLTQTWRLSLDHVPGRYAQWWDGVRELPVTALDGEGRWIDLPRFPLQSVTSVSFFADDDTETVADAATYYVDTQQRPGRVVLRFGQTWPTVALRPANGVQVLFVAGYGTQACDVPSPMRQAIKMMSAYLFEHRGACTVEDAASGSGAEQLIKRYRVPRL